MNKFHAYFLSLFALLLVTSSSVFAKPTTTIGEDESVELQNIDQNSELFLHSSPTGRMQIPGMFGLNDYCTVSLISANEVITAAHCLDRAKDPTTLTVYFEYYTRGSKWNNPYAVVNVELVSKENDIAILEVEGTPGDVYGTYAFSKTAPDEGEALIIYEHQGLSPKSVSEKNCAVAQYYEDMLLHTCDTNNYSSGSPILNKNYEIVAIHQGVISSMNFDLNYGHSILFLTNP